MTFHKMKQKNWKNVKLKKERKMIEKYLYENDLLRKEWKQRRPNGCMVWDGIICPEKWYEYDLKLLYIAKEAYSNEDEDWDIARDGWEDANGLFYVGSNGGH